MRSGAQHSPLSFGQGGPSGNFFVSTQMWFTSGRPEGQLRPFNANVQFKNIAASYDMIFLKNDDNRGLWQLLQCLRLQIHSTNLPKRIIWPVELSGFWSHMWSKIAIFWKKFKILRKVSKHVFAVSFECVLLLNGAQHSPVLCLGVGPKGKFCGSTQMCNSKILQLHMT